MLCALVLGSRALSVLEFGVSGLCERGRGQGRHVRKIRTNVSEVRGGAKPGSDSGETGRRVKWS